MARETRLGTIHWHIYPLRDGEIAIYMGLEEDPSHWTVMTLGEKEWDKFVRAGFRSLNSARAMRAGTLSRD